MKVQELSGAKIKSLNASLVDMIAKDFMPLSVVDNDGFQKFIKELEPRGKLFSVILATRKMDNRHTNEEICRVLREISSDWDVQDKIVAVVTDNAANMEVAESLSSPLLSEFEDLRRACRLIVGHFKSSTLATAKLVKSQEELNRPLLMLKQEVATRWNSTLIMLRRLLEVKTSLTLALTCLPRSPPALTNGQWEILEDCIPLLNPLEELTTELSGDKYMTSSIIIPLIMGAQHLVMNSKPATTVGKRLKEVLLENFSMRLSPYEKQVITSSATILDPPLKKMAFGLEENASKAYNRIQDEEDALHLRENVGVIMSEEEIPTSTSKETSLWSFFEKKTADKGTVRSSSFSQADLRLYIQMPLCNSEQDPLNFGYKYVANMPLVSKMAKKYLCILATSVPSERLLSKAGQICSDLRSRIKSTNVDKLLFINSKIHLLELM
ncbi:hypothetical protein J437_LFUL001311 [Ladona fulva]|uniref:HAT C-terminal dimerisation domain-containing protein n=1 Tax=Ladona fulva TaxID=123851 RepID=A0A8K0NZ48_LADFU|nr:hypothetical protein J437_LFUL001311 [Ladona fulva]